MRPRGAHVKASLRNQERYPRLINLTALVHARPRHAGELAGLHVEVDVKVGEEERDEGEDGGEEERGDGEAEHGVVLADGEDAAGLEPRVGEVERDEEDVAEPVLPHVVTREKSRSTIREWRSIRFRLLICTHDAPPRGCTRR